MFDSPSKPATQEYRENWERIYGPKRRDDGALHLMVGDVYPSFNVPPELFAFQDRLNACVELVTGANLRFVTKSGTVYKITNIGVTE